MSFETRIIRQSLPSQTIFVAAYGVSPPSPTNGANMLPLIPPDSSGAWRYREMKILDPVQPVSNSTLGVQAFECLVVWERYIEEQK
jgi:hypothetical protein